MTELEKQLSAALNKLEVHYNDLHAQSQLEREQFKAGLDGLKERYESALDALEQELKNEREATQEALQLSSQIVANHDTQQEQINALSGQVAHLAGTLPSLTGHCQTLSEALVSLQEQSAQLRAELDSSHER
ncbi:hypothetical protein [Pseudovibrio sp. Ad37]|uniref:hypothetical protein n=1 Tax=Pseudovibrio sp. Ad37 TaxID=989422 RepID=UPI0007AE4DDF|nr:hypothetical protein [Pseudovibrio sp. Ad37]KZL22718.1 hypothetical protein PsAD37_03277 [Pseudovibrio sp. Ad37]